MPVDAVRRRSCKVQDSSSAGSSCPIDIAAIIALSSHRLFFEKPENVLPSLPRAGKTNSLSICGTALMIATAAGVRGTTCATPFLVDSPGISLCAAAAKTMMCKRDSWRR